MENQDNNQPTSQPGQENATPAKQQQSDSNTAPEIETVTPDTEKEGLAHDQKHNHQPELNQADAAPTADHDPAEQEKAERSGSEQGNSSENQLKEIKDAQLQAEENELEDRIDQSDDQISDVEVQNEQNELESRIGKHQAEDNTTAKQAELGESQDKQPEAELPEDLDKEDPASDIETVSP